MNSITVRNAPEPIVPELLEEAIHAYLKPSFDGRAALEDFQGLVARIPADRMQRVATLAQAYEMHLAPVITREALQDWLSPLCTAVGGQPPSGDIFDGRVSGVLAGAPNLPLACLNDRSYAAAVRAFKWWPSGKELIDLLEDHAGMLRSRQRALHAAFDVMASRESKPPKPRGAPTEEEVAAVSAQVTALVQDLRGQSERPASPGALAAEVRPRSAALSPAVLAAILRRDIAGRPPDQVRALRLRLEILERQHPEVRQ